VLRTALLPEWQFGSKGQIYDVSGLGGVSQQKTSFNFLEQKSNKIYMDVFWGKKI
jgi:hypothetical protein